MIAAPVPPRIRLARPDEADAVRELVLQAYTPWMQAIGRRPAPMDDDYPYHIARNEVHVLDVQRRLAAIAVLIVHPDHLLLDNVAVAPFAQGRGFGRRMIAHAESEALRLAFSALRLFTNERMERNIQLYRRLGFVETHRAEMDGHRRVFMTKTIATKE